MVGLYWWGVAGMGLAGVASRASARKGEHWRGGAGLARRGMALRGQASSGMAGMAGMVLSVCEPACCRFDFSRNEIERFGVEMATKTKAVAEKNGNGHAGTNRIAELLPPKSKSSGTILIPSMTVGKCRIEIIGTSPLLVHRFSEKSRRQMEEKQAGAATKAKEKRDPQNDYFQSMYILDGDPSKDAEGLSSAKCKAVHGMPVGGVKNCMIRGAKAAGAVMTDCRSAFFVLADGRCDNQSMVRIDFSEVVRNDGIVRLQGTTADLRYRAEYHDWTANLLLEFNAAQIGIAQLVNLLRVAGFGTGLCEWRPECSGDFGRFTTGKVEDLGQEQR